MNKKIIIDFLFNSDKKCCRMIKINWMGIDKHIIYFKTLSSLIFNQI